MGSTPHIDGIEAIRELAERLNDHEFVWRHDDPDEPAAWTLAKAISEIDGELLAIHERHIPALLAARGEAATMDALVDLAMALRHLIYHVREPPTLDSLVGE